MSLRLGVLVWVGAATLGPSPALYAAGGSLLLEAPFPGLAPQGITHDPTDNTFWVTSALDPVIRHFDAQLTLLGSIPTPFPGSDTETGIAYFPPRDSLLVLNPTTFELLEIDKTGNAILGGINFGLNLMPVVNPTNPLARGLAFHPLGAGGAGSLFIVEAVGALVYEFDLEGDVLRTFVHPDDPDGYPGNGAGVPSGGIELIRDPQGELLAFDLAGETAGNPVIHRVETDGSLTGFDIPLDALGLGAFGSVGGIARATYVDPATGDVFDAIYGTDESGPTLFVIDGTLAPIAEFTDLSCDSRGDSINLTWSAGQVYDTIILERNGEVYQSLPGDATGFADAGIADGVYRYAVRGEAGTLSTTDLMCSGVVGAGQVLGFAELTDFSLAVDLTEDAFDTLWVTDADNVIYGFDKDFLVLAFFDGPFPLDDDFLSGIAYRPETNTLLVYNATTNIIEEIDFTGTSVAPPVLAQIPVPDDDEPFVGALAYDPNGAGGNGLIYAVELTRAVIYKLARDGSVLGSFPHPDEVFLPTPDPSPVDTFCLGISGVPEIGNGYEQLDIAGGTVLDRGSTRIFRVLAEDGSPTGFQMPTDGIAAVNSVRFLAHVNSTYNGDPVAFVVSVRSSDSVILRVERRLPVLNSLGFLDCSQTDLEDIANITFTNSGPYDFIDVERDGQQIATIPGDATEFVDSDPGPGVHRYRLTPSLGGERAEPRQCDVRIGKGALLRRAFIWPAFSPYQMTRDPVDGTFVVSLNSPLMPDLYQFDENLDFIGTIPGPTTSPFQVAALAVRRTPLGREIWSIAWEVRAPFLARQDFFFAVQDAAGEFLQFPTPINIPGPPVGEALTYPAAMVHDPATDTFWFLERNTDTFFNMDLTGTLVGSFAHPLPPFQNFVFNLGLDFDPTRQSFTATTAGTLDTQITKAIGFTPDGILSGEEIPLDAAGINPLYGLARAPSRVWVSGSSGSLSMLLELKAADAFAPPTDLACVERNPSQVLLTWQEPIAYDEVVVRRSGVVIAVVGGGTFEALDVGVGEGFKAYTVAGRVGLGESALTACSLFVAGGAPTFVRGDANGDGAFDGLLDALFLLNFQFLPGSPAPPCSDAADADDDGEINGIVDGLRILTFQFIGGPPPPPPYPDPGADPTLDGLRCG